MRTVRIFLVGIVFACLHLTLSTGRGALQSQPADFYVAVQGNDANPGTLEKPFASLQRAQEAVRSLKMKRKGDILVWIRGGTYYLPKPVRFQSTDSGTATQRIIYAALPNEVPILIGGTVLSGWKQYKENIWQAKIPPGLNPKQVFEDGRRLTAARAPNKGYYRIKQAVKGKEKQAFVYRAEDIRPENWDQATARIFIWPGHDWFSQEKGILKIDPQTSTITMNSTQGYSMKAGNRYYVKNVLAELDEPGECVIDLEKRLIYVWPRKNRKNITIPPIDHVLVIQGQDKQPVRNLHFEGLDLGMANKDVVNISNAVDCSLRNCRIENGYDNGVAIHNLAQRITVYGCQIRFHGQHGVTLTGAGYSRKDINHHNVIENNHIHHCGRRIGHGYGVRISQSGHNRIVHNLIHHMPRYAITIKGNRYQSLRQSVKGVTWENHYEFLHSRKNLLAYNDIHHVNQDSQDTGAIESWGPGRDNVIDHNLIHEVGNDQFDLQSGIYLDDAADHFTVTNNIIYGVVGTQGNQCIFAKGIGNRIENNILVGNAKCTTGIRSFFMADERCDHHEYVRNIIYFPEGPAPPRGNFGSGVGNLQAKGTTLEWLVEIPADGNYSLWLRYACHNAAYGMDDLGGRTSITIDGGLPIKLDNLPNTGSWGTQKWSRVSGLHLRKRKRHLRWTNDKGGGINLDALAFCSDLSWKPKGVVLASPKAGTHLVLVQAESYAKKNGVGRNCAIYDFNNWSDDRVSRSDYNLFWSEDKNLRIKGGPAHDALEKWFGLQNKRYDQHSIIANPRFKDPQHHNYSLDSDSPALRLDFQPIDTSNIGLRQDFPQRFVIP
jgi:parallel beta helix pectate lyase-like protein